MAYPHVRKVCSRRLIKYRRDVWQTCHNGLSQCQVIQQLWATVRLHPGADAVGHSTVPMTECNVAGDKTRRAHDVEDIIDYS
jgi:hypothetical protein